MLGESSITLSFVGIWLRLAVLAVLVAATPVAALAWAVRTRRLSPFSAVGRMVRRLTDPLLDPLVRRFGRFGVRADTAPWWGLLFLLLAGATLIVLLDLIRQVLGDLYLASQGVGDGFLRLIVTWSFELLRLALLVRVIGSWFGWERHPVGRLAWRMTEWMLGPIRRHLPAFGAVDLSPMVAWFALAIAEQLLRGLL
ncbi:MAG: YggT family protein [Gemmatimonadota bacterium]